MLDCGNSWENLSGNKNKTYVGMSAKEVVRQDKYVSQHVVPDISDKVLNIYVAFEFPDQDT